MPPLDATFPANAVAFRLINGPPPFNNSPPPAPCIGDPAACTSAPPPPAFEESFALRTEEGGVDVPASIKTLVSGERVFSPDGPLEPNRRYLLRYDNGFCHYGAKPDHFSFLTTEPLSFPLNGGRLDVVAEGLMEVPNSPTRFMPAPAPARVAFVKLQLVDTSESQPFRALRTYRVEIDDNPIDYYSGHVGRFTLGTSREIFIATVCPGEMLQNPCGGLPIVSAGRHRVRVTPSVLGSPSNLPALAEEIELSCKEDPITTNMPPPAPAPANPAPDPGPAGAAPDPSDPSGGAACSLAAAAQPPGAIGLVLGLLALALRRRRSALVLYIVLAAAIWNVGGSVAAACPPAMPLIEGLAPPPGAWDVPLNAALIGKSNLSRLSFRLREVGGGQTSRSACRATGTPTETSAWPTLVR